ncbi:TRAP transporter small permease [Gymnodinialimonas sp. 57CJ19]|uniref:TRAP transporter small permease subunit n=1 Tax=Gymnodinialimonas sp. 57CJ19 TaxID=3138498 RepID=UPI0031345E4B
MHQFHRLTTKISTWLAWAAGAVILFGCAVPIAIDVVSRATLGRTIVESFEISSYAFAACIGLGMGYTVSSKANIRVDILTAKLPRRLRLGFDLVAALAMALTATALAYYTFDVLAESWNLGSRSQSTLQVPLILPQSLWWAGLVWFATVACLTPLFAAARLFAGDPDGAEALISNPDLMDEIKDIGIDVDEDTP